MTTPSKRQNISGYDRISDLPDSVLCEILSFLPTKLAVSTSILSKRWRFLWTYVPDLDFDGDQDQPHSHFAYTVNRVLLLRREWCIRRFRVIVQSSDCVSLNLNSWVSAAIARNIQELDITILEQVVLPRSIFDSKTLLVLKLVGCGQAMDVPSSALLPKLKSLHLTKLRFKDDDSSYNLFHSCPGLQELVFSGAHIRDGYKYKFLYSNPDCFQKLVVLKLSNLISWDVAPNVSFPSLKILHLTRIGCRNKSSRCLFSFFPVLQDLFIRKLFLGSYRKHTHTCRISSPTLLKFNVQDLHPAMSSSITLQVNAPALKYLEFKDSTTQRFLIENMGSLVKATISGSVDFHALQALCNVTSLHLLWNDLKVVCSMDFFHKLTEFHNLVELQLSEICCSGGLLRMLQKCSCLERLSLCKGICLEELEELEESCWIPIALQLECAPNCLAVNLKTFNFFFFEGSDIEIDLIGYMLKNSLVLESMSVCAEQVEPERRFAVLQKLAEFERGSKKCQLRFR